MKPYYRHRARRYALQALYDWLFSGNNLNQIEAYMLASEGMKERMNEIDVPYFRELLHQIPAHLSQLDEQIEPYCDRPMQELDPIELTLMRMGTYELMFRKDVPYKVVLDEAIDLAKTFGGEDGHKYVNGILDKVAKALQRK